MGVKAREKPKGSGIWYVFISHHGTRKAKKIGRDKALAQRVAKEIGAKLVLKDTGLLDEKKDVPLFYDLAQQWLAVHIKPVKRTTTYKRYSSLLRMYVNPVIGSVPVDEFRRVQVLQVLRSMLRKGLSRASIEQGKNVISGVLEFAIDFEYYSRERCSIISRGKTKSFKTMGYII